MKNKYIRNSKGQYVGGIRKMGAIALLIIFILCGLLYSIVFARGANAEAERKAVVDNLQFHTELTFTETTINRIVDKTNERTMTVSAYTSEARQTDSTPEIGATGENIWKLLKSGVRTCATNDYAFGTKLNIPGIGECVVKDRMNKRYTGRGVVDVYMGYDTATAWKWGRKNLTVTIVR